MLLIAKGADLWGWLVAAAGGIGAGGAAVLVLGFLLFALGLRGRRVNNHPICRRCGFDLSGIPGSAAGAPVPEGTRCGECGVIVSETRRVLFGAIRRRGFVVGQRRRRPALIGLGLTVMIATRAITFGRSRTLGVLLPVTPVGILLPAAQLDDALARDVCAELESRLAKGKLTQDDGRTLGSHGAGLAMNDPRWSELIISAHASGLMDEASFSRFLFDACPLELTARAKFREGGPLAVSLSTLPNTGARPLTPVSAGVDYLVKGISWGGAELGPPIINVPVMLHEAVQTTCVVTPPGAVGSGALVVQGVKQAFTFDPTTGERKVHGEESFIFGAAAEKMPKDAVMVRPMDDPAAGPVIAASLRFADMRCESRVSTTWRDGRRVPMWMYSGSIIVDRAAGGIPRPVSFDVICLWNDGEPREASCGSFTLEAGTSNHTVALESPESTRRLPDIVDIELRPSAAPAERTTRMDRFWDGRLIFRGVRVQSSPAVAGRRVEARPSGVKAEYLPEAAD